MINLVIGLGDSETGETGETGDAGLKAGDGLTGVFGLFTGDTIPDFFDFDAFAAAHFRNNRALTSFQTFKNLIRIKIGLFRYFEPLFKISSKMSFFSFIISKWE